MNTTQDTTLQITICWYTHIYTFIISFHPFIQIRQIDTHHRVIKPYHSATLADQLIKSDQLIKLVRKDLSCT